MLSLSFKTSRRHHLQPLLRVPPRQRGLLPPQPVPPQRAPLQHAPLQLPLLGLPRAFLHGAQHAPRGERAPHASSLRDEHAPRGGRVPHVSHGDAHGAFPRGAHGVHGVRGARGVALRVSHGGHRD